MAEKERSIEERLAALEARVVAAERRAQLASELPNSAQEWAELAGKVALMGAIAGLGVGALYATTAVIATAVDKVLPEARGNNYPTSASTTSTGGPATTPWVIMDETTGKVVSSGNGLEALLDEVEAA